MSRKEKLLLRFLSQPKDFTFDEAVKLLNDFGFFEANTGKTSGSAVRFESLKYPDIRIRFHKPHPNKILKSYVLDIIKTGLDDCDLLTEKRKEDEK